MNVQQQRDKKTGRPLIESMLAWDTEKYVANHVNVAKPPTDEHQSKRSIARKTNNKGPTSYRCASANAAPRNKSYSVVRPAGTKARAFAAAAAAKNPKKEEGPSEEEIRKMNTASHRARGAVNALGRLPMRLSDEKDTLVPPALHDPEDKACKLAQSRVAASAREPRVLRELTPDPICNNPAKKEPWQTYGHSPPRVSAKTPQEDLDPITLLPKKKSIPLRPTESGPKLDILGQPIPTFPPKHQEVLPPEPGEEEHYRKLLARSTTQAQKCLTQTSQPIGMQGTNSNNPKKGGDGVFNTQQESRREDESPQKAAPVGLQTSINIRPTLRPETNNRQKHTSLMTDDPTRDIFGNPKPTGAASANRRKEPQLCDPDGGFALSDAAAEMRKRMAQPKVLQSHGVPQHICNPAPVQFQLPQPATTANTTATTAMGPTPSSAAANAPPLAPSITPASLANLTKSLTPLRAEALRQLAISPIVLHIRASARNWGIRQLRLALRAKDRDGDGTINAHELKSTLLQQGVETTPLEIALLRNASDVKKVLIEEDGKPNPIRVDGAGGGGVLGPQEVFIPNLLDSLRIGICPMSEKLLEYISESVYPSICSRCTGSKDRSPTLEQLCEQTSFTAHPNFEAHVRGSLRQVSAMFLSLWGTNTSLKSTITKEQWTAFCTDWWFSFHRKENEFMKMLHSMFCVGKEAPRSVHN